MLIISFIVPVYNLEEWIDDCLQSLLNVNLVSDTFEVIAWNDGSTDCSERIIDEYSKKYPDIVHLISEENHGVSYSRNHALSLAKGKYIWFVDGDDYIDATVVNSLLKIVEDDNLELLQFNFKDAYPDGTITESYLPLQNTNVMTGRDLFLSKKLFMGPVTYIYNRDFLKKYKIQFPEDFKTCEDIQFNQKALFFAQSARIVPLYVYFYRQRQSSATHSQAKRVLFDHVRRLSAAIDFFKPYNDFKFIDSIILNNIREIYVWMRNTSISKKEKRDIRNLANSVRLSYIPSNWVVRFYLFSLCYFPLLMCSIQKCASILKKSIKK